MMVWSTSADPLNIVVNNIVDLSKIAVENKLSKTFKSKNQGDSMIN